MSSSRPEFRKGKDYPQYIESLIRFSNCIAPHLMGMNARYLKDAPYEISPFVLDEHCVAERKDVEKFRNGLKKEFNVL